MLHTFAQYTGFWQTVSILKDGIIRPSAVHPNDVTWIITPRFYCRASLCYMWWPYNVLQSIAFCTVGAFSCVLLFLCGCSVVHPKLQRLSCKPRQAYSHFSDLSWGLRHIQWIHGLDQHVGTIDVTNLDTGPGAGSTHFVPSRPQFFQNWIWHLWTDTGRIHGIPMGTGHVRDCCFTSWTHI